MHTKSYLTFTLLRSKISEVKKLVSSSWKFYFFILGVIAIGLGFYWLQIRPAQIKHDCSWVKKHTDAIPGRPAMTKEQLISKGIIRSCNAEVALVRQKIPSSMYNLDTRESNGYIPLQQMRIIVNATSCIDDGNKIIEDYKNPKPAIPAKDWYEKVTKEQYTFCLHDKGL